MRMTHYLEPAKYKLSREETPHSDLLFSPKLTVVCQMLYRILRYIRLHGPIAEDKISQHLHFWLWLFNKEHHHVPFHQIVDAMFVIWSWEIFDVLSYTDNLNRN